MAATAFRGGFFGGKPRGGGRVVGTQYTFDELQALPILARQAASQAAAASGRAGNSLGRLRQASFYEQQLQILNPLAAAERLRQSQPTPEERAAELGLDNPEQLLQIGRRVERLRGSKRKGFAASRRTTGVPRLAETNLRSATLLAG